jgi:predicted nucleic acid-binding protein
MIVSDTNLLAFLLIKGDQSELCRAVFAKDPEWVAPFLWRSEFRNVLAIHIQHVGMPLNKATERMEDAQKVISQREFAVRSDEVLEVVANHPVSAYDAEFVCLARTLGTPLVTSDKKLLATFPKLAISPADFLKSTN